MPAPPSAGRSHTWSVQTKPAAQLRCESMIPIELQSPGESQQTAGLCFVQPATNPMNANHLINTAASSRCRIDESTRYSVMTVVVSAFA